jgi:nitrogen fixation NifU-like protein
MPAPATLRYSPALLDHFRRPRNFGMLASPDVSREGANPLCGDHVRIELRIVGDRIDRARFRADACAVCLATASVLVARVEGATLALASAIEPGELLAELAAEVPPARMACATLPVTVLRAGIADYRRRGRSTGDGLDGEPSPSGG